MPVRWTAHIPMAMQQHGGGAKLPHAERPVQPAATPVAEPGPDHRALPQAEAADAR